MAKKQTPPIPASISIPVYYSYDDENNILIDEDGIREEFEANLKEILDQYE